MIELSGPHGELVMSVFPLLAKQETKFRESEPFGGFEAAGVRGIPIGSSSGPRGQGKSGFGSSSERRSGSALNHFLRSATKAHDCGATKRCGKKR